MFQDCTPRTFAPVLVALAMSLAGCGNLSQGERAAGSSLVVGSVIAGNIPTTDIEQVYYLGVFDPQDQLPPTIYRVRLRGQASALNATRYASGWVRADLIDSLSTVAQSKDGGIQITRADEQTQAFSTGRRLVMFGPEGFREAPRDHRLVIAMGSDPGKFFSAVDEALGVVAVATQGRGGLKLEQDLFREMTELKVQRDRLDDIRTDAATGIAR